MVRRRIQFTKGQGEPIIDEPSEMYRDVKLKASDEYDKAATVPPSSTCLPNALGVTNPEITCSTS